MIYGYLHQGSGAGNQLHRYIATRVKALDLGVDWRLIWNSDESGKVAGFKCKDFIEFDDNKIDFPLSNFYEKHNHWHERKVMENGVDIRSYDPEFNFIEDNTIIDGEFQDERYWAHREKEVNEWLKVEPLTIPDDVCIINFRGGEYTGVADLFLTKDYWEDAITIMKSYGVNKFEVHTDDIETARKFFPDYDIISDMALNWRSLRYAKHAIISNSSFAILPRWLNNGITIAPKYWARRNTKTWALPQNYYKRFLYI